ncbi:hypothetical protein [Roseomonas chloroacetimidivorans]|uniref:hypothetical protein n=1 Tax=Roseomonas chloroacetimidivorans TaxID=1766656 RepID=UPI003C7402D1
MALDPRTYSTPLPYKLTPPPEDYKGLRLWLNDEMLRIADVIRAHSDMMPQASDAAPAAPRIGMQRFAVAPWAPNGASNVWVFWNGSAWQNL